MGLLKPLVLLGVFFAFAWSPLQAASAVIVAPNAGWWYWNTTPAYYSTPAPYANVQYNPYTGGYYRPGANYRNMSYGYYDGRAQYSDPSYYKTDPRYGDKGKVFMHFGGQK